jgi:Cu(I)/Ag(I) efflux system membrane fusion protein
MASRVLLAAVVLGTILGGVFYLHAPRPAEPPQQTTAAAPTARYQCAMHPQIVSDHPGVCPICGMKLRRVDEPAPAGTAAAPEPNGGGVPGHAAFTLPTERQQLIGVTKAPVARRALDVEIRAVGRVAYDPGLYQAIVEYREAAQAGRALHASELPQARAGAVALLRGARLKLRQQGLSDAQIERLTRDRADPVELLLPGSAVWIYAEVYEYEAPLVAPGETMVVTAPSQPGRRFTTKVVAVDTILDPRTRTVRVRALLPTPNENLRPESWVDVTIHVPLGEVLALPQGAVLDTGEHQIVFVVKDDGTFEPRSVELGREAQGYYEVLSGVAAGEQVVTSANFLIDSESRFRAALAAFEGPPSAH